ALHRASVVGGDVALFVVAVQAPLPHIPSHIVDTERAHAIGIAHHQRRLPNSAFAGIASAGVKFVPPWINAVVVAFGGTLPLLPGWQRYPHPHLLGQPVAERHPLVPRHVLARAIIPLKLWLQ